MLAVVIPAKNEAARIVDVLQRVLRLPVGLVIPVLNGCEDMTAEVVRRLGEKRIQPIQYTEPLGYDVPRIAGAQAALKAGAKGILFLDGDLTGPILDGLSMLLHRVAKQEWDLALADCYAETPLPYRQSMAKAVYDARVKLNQTLGRPDLKAAIPSHGPAAVSRALLQSVPLAALGVPPLLQAFAVLAGRKVGLGASIPHGQLNSAPRPREHRRLIGQTIIGDCFQAACLAEGRPFERAGYEGYHPMRRFDLLNLEPLQVERPAPEISSPLHLFQ